MEERNLLNPDEDPGSSTLVTESDEEMLIAPIWEGPATGNPARASPRFRTDVMALDFSPNLVVNDALSMAEGVVQEGLSKSSISTYLSFGISESLGSEYGRYRPTGRCWFIMTGFGSGRALDIVTYY